MPWQIKRILVIARSSKNGFRYYSIDRGKWKGAKRRHAGGIENAANLVYT